MIIRKGILFAGALFVIFFQSEPVSAEIFNPTVLPNNFYNFKDDPLLLQWTFSVTNTKQEEETDSSIQTKDDLIIDQWKKKQAHLWDTLPKEPFIINASAYTASADECGKSDGITASGIKVTESRTLACPPSFPFGTKILIEGVGVLRCEDRGGAIKGNHFDIYMETKDEAFAFGRRHLIAEVVD